MSYPTKMNENSDKFVTIATQSNNKMFDNANNRMFKITI